VSRGDIIASPEQPPQRADAFAATLVWMSEHHLLAGRTYLLKCGGQTLSAIVTSSNTASISRLSTTWRQGA